MLTFFKGIFAISILSFISGGTDANAQVQETIMISGSAKILSGDLIEIDNTAIYLDGIYAPLRTQVCQEPEIGMYYCGEVSTKKLDELIAGRIVSCEITGWDGRGAKSGICSTEAHQDLSAEMVKTGWALVAWFDRSEEKAPQECMLSNCPTIREGLVLLESEAVTKRFGLWRGVFDTPWEYQVLSQKSLE